MDIVKLLELMKILVCIGFGAGIGWVLGTGGLNADLAGIIGSVLGASIYLSTGGYNGIWN